MDYLFQTIVDKVHHPKVDVEGGFQLQISQLDYNSYVGVIGIGRIQRGTIKTNSPVVVVNRDGSQRNARVLQVFGFKGLERVEVPQANAGDIIAFTGIDTLEISDTLCSPDAIEALPPLTVDEPTNADAWNLLGFTQRKLGEFDAAGVAYDTALTINPAHMGALEYQGELFLQTGAVDRAKANLETLRGLCGDCEEFGDLQAALKAAGQS
jgi:tetratricopeptide (TPR) repeat protein